MLYCVQLYTSSILKMVAVRVSSTLRSKLHCGDLKHRLCERLRKQALQAHEPDHANKQPQTNITIQAERRSPLEWSNNQIRISDGRLANEECTLFSRRAGGVVSRRSKILNGRGTCSLVLKMMDDRHDPHPLRL